MFPAAPSWVKRRPMGDEMPTHKLDYGVRIPTRRAFLQGGTLAAGAFFVGGCCKLAAADAAPLIDRVAAACKRLAPLGWRQMLLDVTGGALDIIAADLRAELAKTLDKIDRTYPGYADFNVAGRRGIEVGQPNASLLYHAFASPTVVADRSGQRLGGFPTIAEIDAVENYVYGALPPSLDELRKLYPGAPMAIAVFALEYRNTPNSVHARHAELCFSRAGVARLGTIGAQYNAATRAFDGLDPGRPFDFRAVPQRFAPYLAVQLPGDYRSFGPQDFLPADSTKDPDEPGDAARCFWVPAQKLFDGRECIRDLDLAIDVSRDLRNDELARFHQFLDTGGYRNNWRGADLENYPFTIGSDKIASFSDNPAFGPGVIEPVPAPLFEAAQYQGKPLTFPVDKRYMADPKNLEYSSMQVLPTAGSDDAFDYFASRSPNTQRPAPEYLNVRHKIGPDGKVENLNNDADLMTVIKDGGYQAQHYIDFTGDGWVIAHCPQLAPTVPDSVPAYCMVAPPDFFPQVRQRELMLWWQNDVPPVIRESLWPLPPFCLSQTRIAANITLPIGFSIDDVTVSAIVTQPQSGGGPLQTPNGPLPESLTGLPDASPGLFDPGWDTSQGIYFSDVRSPIQKFLTGYGLGSPFVEDAKLCASLGNYWPGVSPDATREFQPNKLLGGAVTPWPSNAPMTDEEIGITPAAGGKFMPWDGVRGPTERIVDGRPMAAYQNVMRVDYVDMPGTMTAALTSRVTLAEYEARVLAMEAVYWALGIRGGNYVQAMTEKSKWSVLSFRPAADDDPDLAEAQQALAMKLTGPHRYRFVVFRSNENDATRDAAEPPVVLIEMIDRTVLFVSGNVVLYKREDGRWHLDTSMPT